MKWCLLALAVVFCGSADAETYRTRSNYGPSYSTENNYGPAYRTQNNYGRGYITINNYGDSYVTVNNYGRGRTTVNDHNPRSRTTVSGSGSYAEAAREARELLRRTEHLVR